MLAGALRCARLTAAKERGDMSAAALVTDLPDVHVGQQIRDRCAGGARLSCTALRPERGLVQATAALDDEREPGANLSGILTRRALVATAR